MSSVWGNNNTNLPFLSSGLFFSKADSVLAVATALVQSLDAPGLDERWKKT
jgi:hypothetical protein